MQEEVEESEPSLALVLFLSPVPVPSRALFRVLVQFLSPSRVRVPATPEGSSRVLENRFFYDCTRLI